MAVQKGDAEVVMCIVLEVYDTYSIAHQVERRASETWALYVDAWNEVIRLVAQRHERREIRANI